jgi:hypothetical protein
MVHTLTFGGETSEVLKISEVWESRRKLINCYVVRVDLILV